MSNEPQINPDVLRAWCETPSHFLPPDLLPAAAQHYQSPGSSPRRHRYTPAEISQQSVDLLLREYYTMVTTQRHNSMHKSEGSDGGVLQRAFLLLCPAPPACCELDHLLKAVLLLLQWTATLLVLSACVLVPVWLGLIRQAWVDRGPSAAAALAGGGLLVLLLADAVRTRTSKQQAAAQAACITADNLQQQLQAGVMTHELDTLRTASRTATTSNSSRPSSITHQARQQQQQQQQQQHQQQQAQRAAAPAPASQAAATATVSVRKSSAGGADSACAQGSYAALQPDLTALQAALGTHSSSRHALGSKEHAVDVLSGLCQELGVTLTPDMTSSPAAMGGVLAQLKQSVGI